MILSLSLSMWTRTTTMATPKGHRKHTNLGTALW
jgi:hypothetical protein